MSYRDRISAPPLEGLRVVDCTHNWASLVGAYLADLGAYVVKLTPADDGVKQPIGPSACGVSLSDALRDRSKAVEALTLKTDEGRSRFEDLVSRAGILILSPSSLGLDALAIAEVRQRHPAIVILCISDFGLAGSYSGWQATGPVLLALSGELSRSGRPGRAPLLPPGDLAYQCAAPQAVFAALLAYLEALQTGEGDLLDFSALDGATQALDPGFGIAGSATLGVPASKLPRGRPAVGHQYPILPCADGKVRIAVLAPRQWQGLFEWMGRPEEFASPEFLKTAHRFKSQTLLPAIGRFFADKTRAQLEDEGARRGVPIAGLFSLEEAAESPQIQARGAFGQIELAPGVALPVPLGVMEIDGVRATANARGATSPDSAAPSSAELRAPPREPGRRPLDGLRVLDLGVIVVGAEQGRLLADQGADVIKVEATAFPDGSRQTNNPLGMSVTIAAGHRNKRSLGVNLKDEEGKALFKTLAAQSDVVLSNFKPGTLDALGLGANVLRTLNPRLIMVDSSAFGSSGPWSSRLGYGPLVRAASGLTSLWTYPDDPESYSDAITVYPDHVAARVGAIGVLALLIRRRRTGEGGAVSISQAEVMLSQMATEIAAAALKDAEGFQDAPGDAPWGVFPCAGDDDWCVVTVRDDRDWNALCAVIDRSDLLANPNLGSSVGRRAQAERVEAALTDWLASRDPRSAMTALQAGGVPAGAMLRVSELPAFGYFKERDLFRTEIHPRLSEPFTAETRPVASSRLADPPTRPAPIMGEHTLEIAQTLLAPLSPAELVDRGVLEPAQSTEHV